MSPCLIEHGIGRTSITLSSPTNLGSVFIYWISVSVYCFTTPAGWLQEYYGAASCTALTQINCCCEWGKTRHSCGGPGLKRVKSMENCFVALTACGKWGGIYSRSPDFNVLGLPERENSHSPDRMWMRACCVDVCSVNSWPSAKPKRTSRAEEVLSSVRLTIPFGANCVS